MYDRAARRLKIIKIYCPWLLLDWPLVSRNFCIYLAKKYGPTEKSESTFVLQCGGGEQAWPWPEGGGENLKKVKNLSPPAPGR